MTILKASAERGSFSSAARDLRFAAEGFANDRRDVQRGRKKIHDGIEDGLDAFVL